MSPESVRICIAAPLQEIYLFPQFPVDGVLDVLRFPNGVRLSTTTSTPTMLDQMHPCIETPVEGKQCREPISESNVVGGTTNSQVTSVDGLCGVPRTCKAVFYSPITGEALPYDGPCGWCPECNPPESDDEISSGDASVLVGGTTLCSTFHPVLHHPITPAITISPHQS